MFYLDDGSHTTATGYHETAKWIDESGTGENLTIQYMTSERISIVFLNCSTDGTEKFEVLGEYPMLFYNFRLTHKCVCWDGCNSECIVKKNIDFHYLSYR